MKIWPTQFKHQFAIVSISLFALVGAGAGVMAAVMRPSTTPTNYCASSLAAKSTYCPAATIPSTAKNETTQPSGPTTPAVSTSAINNTACLGDEQAYQMLVDQAKQEYQNIDYHQSSSKINQQISIVNDGLTRAYAGFASAVKTTCGYALASPALYPLQPTCIYTSDPHAGSTCPTAPPPSFVNPGGYPPYAQVESIGGTAGVVNPDFPQGNRPAECIYGYGPNGPYLDVAVQGSGMPDCLSAEPE